MRAGPIAWLFVGTAIAGCGSGELQISVSGGDADRGEAALTQYQCGVCHVIPGIAGARGQVGPPLNNFSQRVYLAGRLPNTPETLVRFIQDPPALVSDTAMPPVGVSPTQARDIAAYLYRLE
jgi:cytochrome c